MNRLSGFEGPGSDYPGFFRYRRLGDTYLLTGQAGQYAFLAPDELRQFLSGEVESGGPLEERLLAANLVRDRADIDDLAERYRRRKGHLFHGPSWHTLVLTQRCNQLCLYCRTARAPLEADDRDMTTDVALTAVDLAFQSTAPEITLELQGGEPLVRWDLVQQVVDHARSRSADTGKPLGVRLVSNLSLLDDEKLAWLVEREVRLSTSIDGPPRLHDKHRILPEGEAHAVAADWLVRARDAYAARGLPDERFAVEVQTTVTRESLPVPTEVVDELVSVGCRSFLLRPVDSLYFGEALPEQLAAAPADYLAFHIAAVERALAHEREGRPIREEHLAGFAARVLLGDGSRMTDVRNPAGASTLAFHHDGRIFTSDRGRLLAEGGEPFFEIGRVGRSTYQDLVSHPTVRAITQATNLESAPDCVSCVYNPYCGMSPELNYREQGSLVGRMRQSGWCTLQKGLQDWLFAVLERGSDADRAILRRWAEAARAG